MRHTDHPPRPPHVADAGAHRGAHRGVHGDPLPQDLPPQDAGRAQREAEPPAEPPAEAPAEPLQEPRWRRQPEVRPRQILDAALAVFGEKGLAGARLDDIARHAGVAKGTIYLYFPNKEELFREMIRQTVVAELDHGEAAVAPLSSATDQVVGYLRGYWEYVRTPTFRTIYRLVHGELEQFPDLLEFYSREVIERHFRILSTVLARGIARGEFREMDPLVAARMIPALFIPHAVWWCRQDLFRQLQNRSEEQVRDELIDFYLHAIRRSPSVVTSS